jgi:DNA invertase Pin-like site-specific DNA recombinase/uncharacterized Zn finger protein (UPF0148 family)
MLTRYASKNGFGEVREYVDDGYSGMIFARPAFQQMISDVEDGQIKTVLVKDLSRFGRDNSLVLYYVNVVFKEFNTRLIGVNDNQDSANQEDLDLRIQAVFNEMYAKDTSRKVRQTQMQKAERGDWHAGRVPFGYKNEKNKLVIDPEAAPKVHDMFEMADRWCPVTRIAKTFGMRQETVRKMLKNPVYIGDTVNFKHGTVSLKAKVQVPENKIVTKKGTHEAIVDTALFDRVQEKITKYHRVTKPDKCASGVFTGMLICGSCGCPLIQETGGSYRCQQCYQHTIEESDLVDQILADIEKQTGLLKTIPDEIVELRKAKCNIRAKIRSIIESGEDDDELTDYIHQKEETERSLAAAKAAMEHAKHVREAPTPVTPYTVAALVSNISVNRNSVDITYLKGETR